MNHYDRTIQEPLLRELRNAGANISKPTSIRCPFHDDRTASSGVWKDDNGIWRFKCQACGVGGDVFDVMSLSTGKSIKQILKENGMSKTSHNCGNDRSVAKDSQPGVSERKPTGKSLPMKPPNFTGQRKQSGGARTVEQIQASWQEQGLSIAARYSYRSRDNSKLLYLKVRLEGEDGKQCRFLKPCKDGKWLERVSEFSLYNLQHVDQHSTIFVVEGEKCCDYLMNLGFCAVTSGACNTADKVNWSALKGKKIYIWPDNDDNGFKYSEAVQGQLLNIAEELFEIQPEHAGLDGKGEDCADLQVKFEMTDQQVKECITDTFMGIAIDRSPAGRLIERGELMARGEWQAIEWPWPALSRQSNALLPATVTIVCGAPGSAKSFFMLQSMFYWFQKGIKCAIYELEDDNTFHLNRTLAQVVGNNRITDPRYIEEKEPDLISRSMADNPEVAKFGRLIYESPDTELTAQDMLKWIEARFKEGCRIVAIDPITNLSNKSKPWELAQDIMREAKFLVRRYQTSLVLVTHPGSSSKGKSTFSLDDLAGGKAYQRFSQTVIWVQKHEPAIENTVSSSCGPMLHTHNRTAIIAKVRNAPGGEKLAYQFKGYSLTFDELGPIQKK